jgi:hypothetical protein
VAGARQTASRGVQRRARLLVSRLPVTRLQRVIHQRSFRPGQNGQGMVE